MSLSVTKLILFVKVITALMGHFVQPHVLRTQKFLLDALFGLKNCREEAMMNEKFGVVQCIHCGYIQGRELAGSVFSHQGPFKSVGCYNCKKMVPLTAVNVLFKSDSAAVAHGWLVAYKKQIIRGT